MGWATDLQDASFRGVQFECTATSDVYTKALAIHQAPYSDDAEIEDMGIDPRKISINAIYTGDDYKTWLDALETVLAQNGPGELIHPIYGILQVQVSSWKVDHDAENVDSCTIAIEFVKAKAEKRQLFIPTTIPLFIADAVILNKPLSALDKFLNKLKKYYPTNFINTITKIRNGLQKAYKFINKSKKFIDKLLSPKDWMYGLVDDVRKLVKFNFKDISAISKWRSLSKQVKKLGSIFDKNDSSHSPALRQAWRATVVAAQVAIVQEVVRQTRDEMAKPFSPAAQTANTDISTQSVFVPVDALDETNTTTPAAVTDNQAGISLTPPELAVIRQTVRQDLQQAIVDERAISIVDVEEFQLDPVAQVAAYKQAADWVHQQIQQLIETRPPITTTIIYQPSTVHLLAHQLYGDFTRASEILRLNPNLENPAVLRTGQELVVYAR